jgi:hypothetical protein
MDGVVGLHSPREWHEAAEGFWREDAPLAIQTIWLQLGLRAGLAACGLDHYFRLREDLYFVYLGVFIDDGFGSMDTSC